MVPQNALGLACSRQMQASQPIQVATVVLLQRPEVGHARCLMHLSKEGFVGGNEPRTPPRRKREVPGFEMASWQTVHAPKGTPKPIVDRLAQEISLIVKESDMQEKLGVTMGMELKGSTPEQLRELMATGIPRWAEVVKKPGAIVDYRAERESPARHVHV